MAVTIKDIARTLNLTHTTVSRAIHNRGRVSIRTRQKVLEEVEKSNYRPHNIARALRSSRSNLLAVIVPDVRLYFFPSIIRGIEDEAEKAGYCTILCNTNEEWEAPQGFVKAKDKARRYLEKLTSGVIDGFIMAPLHDEMMMELYQEEAYFHELPFVFVDRYIKGIETDYVVGNNLEGGYEVTKHLIELGHRRIAFVSEALCSSLEERLEGYKRALRECGIPLDEELIVISDVVQKEAGAIGTKRLLQGKQMPTAIFACNDLEAASALEALQEAGMKVPDDVALAGYDDSDIARRLPVPLTTVSQEPYEMGQISARILIDRIEGALTEGRRHVRLDNKLVIRGSTLKAG